MEHPFLSTTELSELSIDDIQEKISEITKKLGFAYSMNNQLVVHQLQMALESYNAALQKKFADMTKKEDGNDHQDKIDIS